MWLVNRIQGLPAKCLARRGGCDWPPMANYFRGSRAFRLALVRKNCSNIPSPSRVKPMSDKDHSSAEDQELVRSAQKGDMGAFEELVARHRDKIYARALSIDRK